MQKDPPWYSSGWSLPSRARMARSLIIAEISVRPRVSVLGTMGVISPVGVATATLMSIVGDTDTREVLL